MTKSERSTNLVRLALIGGLAGGAAEVLWVLFYSGLSEVNAVVVAREVTASLWPAAATWSIAPLLGVATHMVLALALAALCGPQWALSLRYGPSISSSFCRCSIPRSSR